MDSNHTSGIKCLPIVLLMLLAVIPSYAVTEYTKLGDDAGRYYLGIGYWNDGSTIAAQYTKSGAATGIPLIYDFDNDGSNEIAAFKGNILTIYEGKTLVVAAGYTFSGLLTAPPLYSFDIDGDSTMEIITAVNNGSSSIYILSYNGSLNLESTIGYATMANNNILIGCLETNKCTAFGNNGDHLRARSFNSSEFIQSLIEIEGSAGTVHFPNVKSLAVGDYNNDGSNEYVISVIKDNEYDVIKIFWINPDINGSIPAGYEHMFTYNPVDALPYDQIEYYVTPPVLYDFDISSSGLETAVGFQRGTDNQVLYMFDSYGAQLDRYPALTETTGTRVSNVIVMKAKPEPTLYDACLLGYDETNNNTMLTCGNPNSEYTIDTRVYTGGSAYLNTALYNFGNGVSNYQQYFSGTGGGYDLDEILTPTGVYALDWNSCDIWGDCIMDLIFSTAAANITTIQVDYEKIGKPDLISITPNNIWYVDDGYENNKGNISFYQINPCFPSAWKVNTTVFITFTGSDAEGDAVQGTAWFNGLYYQSEWSPSGATFSYGFTANETGLIEFGMSVRDSYDNSTNTTYTFSNTVALIGVETGDCITTNNFLPAAPSNLTAEAADMIPADSKVIENLMYVSNLFGISLFILFMLIIVIIDIMIFMRMPQHSIGIIALVDTMLLIIGVKFNIVPLGIVIVISIVGLIVIGIWVSSRFTGVKNG